MKGLTSAAGRKVLAASGLLLGVILAAVFVANRQEPAREEAVARIPSLRVIEVQPLPFRLEARGPGVTRPAESWQAVANVPGRVVERHPGLESGTLLRKGTLLLALDPGRVELTIAETEAELASLGAEQSHLDEEAANTRRLLDLQRERLALAEQELERIERLAESGSVSPSARDEQLRATLAQRQSVTELENRLALIPSQRKRLAAQADRTRSRLEQARQDLEDTRFEAPYDLRIGNVDIALHEHANAGQRLFHADSIEATEIETHVPLSMLRRVMGSVARATPPADALDIGERLDLSAIHAEVALAGAEDIRWSARVTRVANGLDPKTRTARVVVTVDRPYEKAAPPDRPALQPGMYVQVRLSAASPEPLLAVPAAALHGDTVYRVTDDDRLEHRAVTVAFEQNDLAVIADGIAAGDRVIVDDPVPALEGMALQPQRAETLEQRLRTRARGETP